MTVILPAMFKVTNITEKKQNKAWFYLMPAITFKIYIYTIDVRFLFSNNSVT